MMASIMRSACASVMVLMASSLPGGVVPSSRRRLPYVHRPVAFPLASGGASAPHVRDAGTRPPSRSNASSKSTKPYRRSTASRSRWRPARSPGLLGGNGAGKTTTIATIMGLTTPTSGRVTVLGADMPRQRYRVLHRMNFESPYVAMPMRLTIRQNLTVFGMLYGVARSAAPHRGARRATRSHRTARSADRQAFRRAEDPRRAGQGLDQFARNCCCSTSRQRRSIPTPPTGCAAGSNAIAASATPRC